MDQASDRRMDEGVRADKIGPLVPLRGEKDGFIGAARSVLGARKHTGVLDPNKRGSPYGPTSQLKYEFNLVESARVTENVGVRLLCRYSIAFVCETIDEREEVLVRILICVTLAGLIPKGIRVNPIGGVCEEDLEMTIWELL